MKLPFHLPHGNRNHPAGTAGNAVGIVEHAPVMHRPAVPRSLRNKTRPQAPSMPHNKL